MTRVKGMVGVILTPAEADACLSALSMMLAGELPDGMTGHQWNAAERAHAKLAGEPAPGRQLDDEQVAAMRARVARLAEMRSWSADQFTTHAANLANDLAADVATLLAALDQGR